MAPQIASLSAASSPSILTSVGRNSVFAQGSWYLKQGIPVVGCVLISGRSLITMLRKASVETVQFIAAMSSSLSHSGRSLKMCVDDEKSV